VRLPEVVPGDAEIAEIIGIVGDVVYWPIDEPPGPDVYQPALQFSQAWMTVLARVRGSPAQVLADVRAAMLNVDPNLPMFDVASLDSLVRAGRADRRFVMVLLLAAALWSMVLAAVGVYGVTASWLEGRGRELAIRLALGAEPAGLVRRVMRSSLAKAAAGAAAGLLLSGFGGRLAQSLLFGVAPQDPVSLGAAAGVMLAVVAAAAYLPARRAGRVDPMHELKAE
jgi:ABC-type antimicrobial peptide transport system permease subunit